MDVYEYLDHVNSKEDLLKFLVYLQKDFKVNRDEWKNVEVETYLEALNSWLGSCESVYINQERSFQKIFHGSLLLKCYLRHSL